MYVPQAKLREQLTQEWLNLFEGWEKLSQEKEQVAQQKKELMELVLSQMKDLEAVTKRFKVNLPAKHRMHGMMDY